MTLLSPEYQKLLEETHQKSHGEWGATACKRILEIADYATRHGTPDTMLDYGSAGGKMQANMRRRNVLPNTEIIEYDPGYPDKADSNVPCDFVVCIDVLEHIEPACLDDVLQDLHRCMKDKGLFDIAMFQAHCKLADGSQSHLIVEDQHWWKEKLVEYFNILEDRVMMGPTYRVYVERKDD